MREGWTGIRGASPSGKSVEGKHNKLRDLIAFYGSRPGECTGEAAVKYFLVSERNEKTKVAAELTPNRTLWTALNCVINLSDCIGVN